MKVNAKKTAGSRGKGKEKDMTGTQTITSMFKRQMATTKKQAICSPTKSSGSDDDVKIIKVETESSYFSGKSSDSYDSTKTQTRRKLSLRKSLSSKETHGTSECAATLVVKDELCVQESSQKENCLTTRQEKTLNVRKRKSDTMSECDKTKRNKNNDGSNVVYTESEIASDPNFRDNTSVGESVLTGNNTYSLQGDILSEEKSSNETKDIIAVIQPDVKVTQESTSTLPVRIVSGKMNRREQNQNTVTCISDQAPSTSTHKQTLSTSIPSHKPESNNEVNVDDENEGSCQQIEDLENDGDVGPEYRTPYYLENFRTVLNTVFDDENNAKLYNSDDMTVISTFNELSEAAQKLYLRLFCRKWTWLPLTKLKYPGIAEDLQPAVDELVLKNLLITDVDLSDLKLVLKLLSGGDIKTLGKMYHINTASQNKVDITDLLIKKTKQNTIGSMFKMAGNTPETVMLNRAKKLLGTCICVAEEPRNVFARTLMLFSLTDTVLDEDSSGQSLQLFQMLRVNIGQVTYPTFTVNKRTQIFSDRDALLRFCKASLMEFDILTKLERHKYTEAYSVYLEAVKQYDKLNKDKHTIKFDKKLPVFLRPYTAVGVYTRVLNQGVEILQRRKDYQAAVDLLQKLLSQDCHCQHYRGHWWERLALNYDTHLKKQDLALQAVESGLGDELVRTGRRLALYQRAEKICNAAKSKFKARIKDFHHEELLELPLVTIEGQTLSDGIEGQKYKFMIQYSETETDDIGFCRVEEVVLDHYKHNGFTDGIHAEGSVISCLFSLLFWDILFMDIPDVFHSPYQTHPLDMHTEDFYNSRQKYIDERLELIHSSSEEDLKDMVGKTWEEHEGTMCSGVNWERFNSLQHVQGLVECIGGKMLSGIMGRYVRDPRHTRSGFPDLTLWNTETKHFKICEVKGPGDKLSHKQKMWLDFLLKLGVDAEVCHVKAVGSKRLKKTPSII